MPTISEIRPSGGGDYTTLAAWETFADGQASGDQWAECYTGGDLGFVDLNGWTGTINASTYPRIYGAAGNRHDGDITAGAYISDVSGYIAISVDYVEVDGIRCSGRAERIITVGVTNPTIKNCLIENTSTTPQCILLSYSTNGLIFNNICIGGSSGIAVTANASGNASAQIYNNTIYGAATSGLRAVETANSCVMTMKNNIIMDSTLAMWIASGTPTITSDYNIVDDTTLTSEGIKGTNDIESATLAAVLTDAANDDFSLVSGSPAIDSGLDLSATIDAFDIAGTARGTWDRGAFAAEGPIGSPWYYFALQH